MKSHRVRSRYPVTEASQLSIIIIAIIMIRIVTIICICIITW